MLKCVKRHTHAADAIQLSAGCRAVNQFTEATRRSPPANIPCVFDVTPFAVCDDAPDVHKSAIQNHDLQSVVDLRDGGCGAVVVVNYRGQLPRLSNGQFIYVYHDFPLCFFLSGGLTAAGV